MKRKRTSLFITFEGPEGSGKSTQAGMLAEWLEGLGYTVVSTREPGGTRIGEAVRDVLLSVEHSEMNPRAEALLFSAARAQLVFQVIEPALKEGKIVISDRYADSTMAYQGYGHGLDIDTLKEITKFATGGLTPHLTFYLDIPIEEGLKRKHRESESGGEKLNRLDMAAKEFHERVRNGYLQMAENDERWHVIKAEKSPETIQSEIRKVVKEALAGKIDQNDPPTETAK